MTKYQAGDEVTIRLYGGDAARFNDGNFTQISPRQIISHTPKRDLLAAAEQRNEFEEYDQAIRDIIQYLREKEAERG